MDKTLPTPPSEMPDYITEFIKAICPEAPNLYLASFNEEQCLKDATEKILDLERRLREALAERDKALEEIVAQKVIIRDVEQRAEAAERRVEREGMSAEEVREACAQIADAHPDTLDSIGGPGSGTFKAISKTAAAIRSLDLSRKEK